MIHSTIPLCTSRRWAGSGQGVSRPPDGEWKLKIELVGVTTGETITFPPRIATKTSADKISRKERYPAKGQEQSPPGIPREKHGRGRCGGRNKDLLGSWSRGWRKRLGEVGGVRWVGRKSKRGGSEWQQGFKLRRGLHVHRPPRSLSAAKSKLSAYRKGFIIKNIHISTNISSMKRFTSYYSTKMKWYLLPVELQLI